MINRVIKKLGKDQERDGGREVIEGTVMLRFKKIQSC